MAESIVLYTDGGNRNTGNQAGGSVRPTDKSAWAALLIYGDHEKMLSDGDYGRTNNYMEIMAVIQGLKALKRTDIPVDVYSDSAYVINTMQQRWWVKWQQNNGATMANQLKMPSFGRPCCTKSIALKRLPFTRSKAMPPIATTIASMRP